MHRCKHRRMVRLQRLLADWATADENTCCCRSATRSCCRCKQTAWCDAMQQCWVLKLLLWICVYPIKLLRHRSSVELKLLLALASLHIECLRQFLLSCVLTVMMLCCRTGAGLEQLRCSVAGLLQDCYCVPQGRVTGPPYLPSHSQLQAANSKQQATAHSRRIGILQN